MNGCACDDEAIPCWTCQQARGSVALAELAARAKRPHPSPKPGTCFQTEHVHPLSAPNDEWEIKSLSAPDPDVPWGTPGDRAWLYLGRRRIDGSLCHVWRAVDGASGPAIAQTLAYHGTP